MVKTRWKPAAVISSVVVGLAASACGGAGGDSGASGPSTTTAVIGGFSYDTLDPGAPTGFLGPSLPMARPFYGWLFRPPTRPEGDFVPDLATGYQYAPDLTSVTITLRPGTKFTDGTPFDADAIVSNIERYAGKQSPNKQWYDDIASATAVDPTTVKVTFTHPDSNFINMLAYTSGGLMSSPTAIKKAGEADYGLSPVGAGPFKIAKMVPSQELDLVPNPDYWDAKDVKLKGLNFINTSRDASVVYQDIVSGSIDTQQFGSTSTPPNVLDQAKADQDLQVDSGPDNSYIFLALNSASAPFDNAEARQAIAYCTDRESLAKGVMNGWTSPTYLMGGSDTQFYPYGNPAGAKQAYPYPFDVAKSKSLVQNLGGLSFKFVNLGGQGLTISNALAQSWKQCGIDAKVSVIPGPQLAAGFASGDFQMALSPEGGLSDPHFYRSFEQDTTPQGSHTTVPLGDAVPNLVKQVYTTTDKAELQNLFQQLFGEINRESALIPLVSGPNYFVTSKCLTGADYTGFGAGYAFASKTC
jgi:peptide/nickel transport system substrate-binding protein